MLEWGPANTSMETHGGFMEIPSSATLGPAQFTLEAVVRPMWSPSGNLGRYYCVLEFGAPAGKKTRGYALYAGPQDASSPATLQTPYRWQLWLGDGTNFKQVTDPSRPPALVEFDKTNYLAVTFDGAKVRLFTYFPGKAIEEVLAVDAAAAYSPSTGLGVPFFIGLGLKLFPPFPPATPPPPLAQRYPFFGRMQEVALYRTALGTDRIMSHIFALYKDL
jgi:hypothetical protein